MSHVAAPTDRSAADDRPAADRPAADLIDYRPLPEAWGDVDALRSVRRARARRDLPRSRAGVPRRVRPAVRALPAVERVLDAHPGLWVG